MISQELLDEIIYLSLKNQYINKELIEKIVLDIINNCDKLTQNLFGGLYFETPSLNFCLAEVDENNRVVANYEEMLKHGDLAKYQSYLERNLKIIGYLLHEIEHLKEEWKLEKGSFESSVITLGNSEYVFNMIKRISNQKKAEFSIFNKYEAYYEKNWGLIPTERIAEVNARKSILNSLNNYDGFSDDFFSEYKNLTKYYIDGLKMEYEERQYSIYRVPLFRFFKSLASLEDMEHLIHIAPKLSTEKKMMYGFPITPRDMVEINKMKIKGRR